MVSLGENNGQRQGGYFQFENPPPDTPGGAPPSDVSLRSHVSTEELMNSSVTSDAAVTFRRINTTPVIVVLILLTVCMEVAACLVPHLCHTSPSPSLCGISSYSIVVYTHAVLWFIVMLIDRYLRRAHGVSRMNGYLEFYRKTRNIRRTPLMVYSGGMSMLTVVMVLMNDYCMTSSSTCPGLPLSTANYLQLLISIETIVVLPVLLVYLAWTVRFNRRCAAPDVNSQEDVLSAYTHAPAGHVDIGFRDEDYLDDVLEKQADLIRYLKQHNSHLGRKILKLTAQVQQLQPTSGDT